MGNRLKHIISVVLLALYVAIGTGAACVHYCGDTHTTKMHSHISATKFFDTESCCTHSHAEPEGCCDSQEHSEHSDCKNALKGPQSNCCSDYQITLFEDSLPEAQKKHLAQGSEIQLLAAQFFYDVYLAAPESKTQWQAPPRLYGELSVALPKLCVWRL